VQLAWLCSQTDLASVGAYCVAILNITIIIMFINFLKVLHAGHYDMIINFMYPIGINYSFLVDNFMLKI